MNRREQKSLDRKQFVRHFYLKKESLARWAIWYTLNKPYLLGEGRMVRRSEVKEIGPNADWLYSTERERALTHSRFLVG